MFWLERSYLNIPIQMCLFHQKAIVRKNITKNPELEPNKELKEITFFLWKLRKETWLKWFYSWQERNIEWIKERNYDWWFKHAKTRSAFNSLKRNIEFLFVYCDLDFLIPKTTNSLEAVFWHVKDKLRNYRWLKKERKLKLIYHFLK